MAYDINGKTILITGANRGIGKAFVQAFLTNGAAKIYAAVRNLDSVNALVEEHGNRVVPIHLDLEDPKSIIKAAESARDVHVVVNNAGVLRKSSPLDPGALESLTFEMNVNVHGLIRMAQAFAPVLEANGGGVFVQLNSVASLKNFADFATYSSSKAAAYSLTQGLREVLGKQGTHVLSVHPGPIATDMADAAGMSEVAEPPSVVAESLIDALKTEEFHVFPDTLAKQTGMAYKGFAESVIEGVAAVG